MTKTTVPISKSPDLAAGLLLGFLSRYADQSPNRSPRELDFARQVDALPDARTRVQEAVKQWRAKPLEERTRLIGSAYASLDSKAPMSDRDWQTRVGAAMSSKLVQTRPGLYFRHQTMAETPVGAPAFSLPDMPDTVQDAIKVIVPPGGKAVTPQEEQAQADKYKLPGPIIGKQPPVSDAAKAQSVALYQLEFAGLYAKKETSWDMGSSSDEVYANFSMMADNAYNWAKRSAVYGSMDSGDAKGEDPRPCVLWGPAPLPAEPLSLATLLMEHDYGNPNAISQHWHDAAVVGACIVKYSIGVDVPDKVVDAAANLAHWIFGLGDDKLGADSTLLWPDGLGWLASQPLIHWKGLAYHFFLFHTDNDAKYYTFYRVIRVQ